ncbi:MAG: VanZ family protein [Bacilli bacterium]
MFTDIFLKAAHNVWPMVFIFTIIIVSLRLFYLMCNKQKIVLYKELSMLAFIIYILLLYYIVTFQENNYGTNNLVPFKEIFRYSIFSPFFVRNVIGNILLFVPFGMFSSYYVKNKSFFPTFLLTFITSASIEFAQISIGRTADVDDIILNVLGGVLGYLFYKSSSKIVKKMPEFIKSSNFLNVIMIFIIFLIIYVAFHFRFWGMLS